MSSELSLSCILILRSLSGVAGHRSLVGLKYGKWSLVALILTTPLINTALLSIFSPQSGLFLPYSHRIERKSGIFQSKVDALTRATTKEWQVVVQFIKTK